ncbi:HdeD family acid-resistance protein [Sphingomonas desiccabilis]|uniref:HdeD family acid-resistance protein n=1 Tax=Sphingomonas desiccabilis TaxID=429134 RepID=A0A4Q2J0C4_9SPHN|nr:HdeD family acid-resistance protein [Sphingomonas desiccabilis]MBB3910611.1 uncharacterized membrane protein HdeD (DUF308 family) [Sphingomonas desiccabilis]RXZ35238.1 HdeD family acid-resistance protein [Sphingomonas desiccabilis]
MTDFRTSPEDPAGAMPRTGAGWGWILLYGIASAILGLLAFAWPFSATIAVTIVIGSFFLISGVLAMVAGFAGRGHDVRGYSIAYGILSLIVGLMLMFRPLAGAISLTLLVAIWLAVRGLMEIRWGLKLRQHRALMLVLGAVNLVLAILILATVPFSALTLPGYILGFSFLLGGVTAIASGIRHRAGAPAFDAPR